MKMTTSKKKTGQIFALLAAILLLVAIFGNLTLRGTLDFLEITFDYYIEEFFDCLDYILESDSLEELAENIYDTLLLGYRYCLDGLYMLRTGESYTTYFYDRYHGAYYENYYENYYRYDYEIIRSMATSAVWMLATALSFVLMAVAAFRLRKGTLATIGVTLYASVYFLSSAQSYLVTNLHEIIYELFYAFFEFDIETMFQFAWYYVPFVIDMLGVLLFFVLVAVCVSPKMRAKCKWLSYVFFAPAALLAISKVSRAFLSVFVGFINDNLSNSTYWESFLNLFNVLSWCFIVGVFFFCFWMTRNMGENEECAAEEDEDADDVYEEDDTDSVEEDDEIEQTVVSDAEETIDDEATEAAVEEATDEKDDPSKIDFSSLTDPTYQPVYVKHNDTSAAAKSIDGIADKIKKYKELLDMGAITEDEFAILKKQLLGL